MVWPADTLAGVYLFLFAFGLIFSAVSLLLGVADNVVDVDLPGGDDVEQAATHGQAPGGVISQFGPPSPLNLSTAMIFLTWFGAAGYILRAYYGAVAALSLLVALPTGLLGAWLVYLFLARVLWRGQTQLDPANYVLVGTPARVSSPIRAGGAGEVVYTLDGKRRVDGARSVDGAAVPVGTAVVIARYERGLTYVEPWAGAMEEGPFLGRPVEPLAHPPPPVEPRERGHSVE